MGSGPQIHDFTSERRQPPVVTTALHSAADLLLTMWIVAESETDRWDAYDVGADWFHATVDRLSEPTRAALDEIGSGYLWVGMLAMLPELRDNSTISDLLNAIEDMDPVDLRFKILMWHGNPTEADRELAADAAEGNRAALEELLSRAVDAEKKEWRDALDRLLIVEPQETKARILTSLRGFTKDVFADREAEFRPILERDAAAKRAMARRMSPQRLVEIATNGISVEDSAYRRPIVLIPAMVSRPWVIFTESPENLVMAYPVAEEYLDADPDAPPQWLIKTYKALGDERRLRLLRRLARGPASLRDLTEEMDASKSTLHHHLMLLRAAGLVRVTIGVEKEYSLRDDVVPEATGVLQAYINQDTNGTSEEEST